MTVEFHNSKNSVWTAIQEALQHAGFVVADVRTLDKQQGTFKQVQLGQCCEAGLGNLGLQADGGLEEQFKKTAGTEDGAWEFVRSHLKQLPVFVPKGEDVKSIAERQGYLLFDRMVAFHVQRGYHGSAIRRGVLRWTCASAFPNVMGCTSCPIKSAEYDRKRLDVKEVRAATSCSSATKKVRFSGFGGNLAEQANDLPRLAASLHERSPTSVGEARATARAADDSGTELRRGRTTGRWRVPDPKKEATWSSFAIGR